MNSFAAILITLAVIGVNVQAEVLRGVTVKQSWPHSYKINEKFEGFGIDLINEIADIVGFEYRMYTSPDNTYGIIKGSRVTGMIGEVHNNRADFAIADITVTEERRNFVEFTEPFMESNIVVLLNKNHSRNINSFEDLAQQSEVKYGPLKGGSTYRFFSKASDPTLRKMYLKMATNPDSHSVKCLQCSLEKIILGQFALIGESSTLEFLSGRYCDLTIIDDKSHQIPIQYAIALPKHSVYVNLFNNAIKQLKASGQLDKLKARYWSNRCEN